MLWPSYKKSKFFTLTTLRLTCIFYCLVLFLIHLIPSSIHAVKSIMGLSEPILSLTIVAYLFCAILHIRGLLRTLKKDSQRLSWFRSKVRPKESRKIASNIFEMWFTPDGLYGRRGREFETRLILREILEIPCHTIQAYTMSLQVPDPIFSTAYALIIVFNCVVTPFLFQRKTTLSLRETLEARNAVMLLDITVDIILNIIMPFTTLIPNAVAYLESPLTVSNDKIWVTKFLSTCKYSFVTSFSDLLISILPMVFTHFMLNTLHQNWSDSSTTKSSSTKQPLQIQRKSRLKLGYTIASLLWGFGLAAIVIQSQVKSSGCNDTNSCKLHVTPWVLNDSNSCECLFIYINCEKKDGRSVDETLLQSGFGTESALTLMIEECRDLAVAPVALNNFTSLIFLEVKHTSLTSFDVKLHEMPSLFLLWLEDCPIATLPVSLKHLPPELYFLGVTDTLMTSLPSWIGESWGSVSSLSLFLNPGLTNLPDSIAKLQNLQTLNLYSCNLTELPSAISSLGELMAIWLQGNSLQTLPRELLTLPNLQYVNAAQNNITAVSNGSTSSSMQVLILAHNPICTNSNSSLVAAGCNYKVCSPLCDPFMLEDIHCQEVCNNAACNYDDGQCNATSKSYYSN